MSLNEYQQAHVQALNASPEKVCGCGWYWHEECQRLCQNKTKQTPEDKRINDMILFEREQCAKIIDKFVEDNYKLKDIPEYKSSNEYRRYNRFYGRRLAREIRRIPWTINCDFD